VKIPASTQGYHRVGVYGSSFTPKGTVPDSDFEVIPQIELQPTSGNRGTPVTITGTGFAKEAAVTITFDETTLDVGAVADDSGSFSTTFEVPRSKGEEHAIVALDSHNNSARASFTTEKTPPAPPELLLPGQEVKLEMFGSVGGVMLGAARYLAGIVSFPRGGQRQIVKSSMATFDWSDTADSDDVSYVFQIAAGGDFSSPVVVRGSLAHSEYTLAEEDVLIPGSYSWRIQATDDVGNESEWSQIRQFEVVPTSTQVLFLSVAIPVVFIAIVLASIILTWRASGPKP